MQEEPIKKPADANNSGVAKEEKSELEICQQKCEEYLNNWKRAAADMANYKKDEMERVAFLGKYLKEDMILKVLPILDSIDLAATALGGVPSEGGKKQISDEWFKGFLQIQKQIEEFLKKEGIEEIVTVGEKFSPETMEVVEEIDLPAEALAKEGGGESGMVVEELQKGFKMDGKVLRPARVKISK